MMKKIYLLPILALLPLVSSAQGTIGYSYDAAGNRVKREIVMPVPKAMAKQQTFAADGQAFTDMLRDHTVKIYPNPTEGGLQVSNSVKYVGSKNQKEFLKDLKLVYAADTKEKAETELNHLEDKWGELYPIVIKSWRDKWEMLSCYFQYTAAIRKIIYTTNTVEGYHRQVRKITKTKGVFPNNDALYKLVYLDYRNIRKKWTMSLANWGQTAQQLAIKFGDRFKIM